MDINSYESQILSLGEWHAINDERGDTNSAPAATNNQAPINKLICPTYTYVGQVEESTNNQAPIDKLICPGMTLTMPIRSISAYFDAAKYLECIFDYYSGSTEASKNDGLIASELTVREKVTPM